MNMDLWQTRIVNRKCGHTKFYTRKMMLTVDIAFLHPQYIYNVECCTIVCVYVIDIWSYGFVLAEANIPVLRPSNFSHHLPWFTCFLSIFCLLFVMDVELGIGLTKKVVILTNMLEVDLHFIYLTKYLVPNDKCKELGYMQVWHFIAKRNFLCHMSHMLI